MTSEALIRHGVQSAVVPEKYSSGGILDYFSKSELKGRRVVLIRSSAADDHLSVSLTSRGAFVETITVYRSTVPTNVESVLDFLDGLRRRPRRRQFSSSPRSSSLLSQSAPLLSLSPALYRPGRVPCVPREVFPCHRSRKCTPLSGSGYHQI